MSVFDGKLKNQTIILTFSNCNL